MDDRDLTALSASGIAAMVHDGRTSAVRVARAHLARIAERDGEPGAFRAHTPALVLAQAGSVDSRADRFALPLAGVPVAIEDDVDVAGYSTRHVSRDTDTDTDAEPARRDDELVRRLRAAGAVVVGKTRMPGSAGRGFSRSELGRARSPLDPGRDPGGSSGSAVAVAAGMAALALGTDDGGSIRIPAAYHGLVGLKPGRGVVPPADGSAEHRCGLGAAGPLARSAADAALMFEVLTGGAADPEGPAADRAEVGWPARVALSLRSPFPMGRLHPDHRAAAVGAAARLRAEGVAVTISDPGRRVLRPAGPRGRAPSRWQERYLGWLDGHDLMIGPATATGPSPAGPRGGRYLPALLRSATRTYAPAWDLAGLPAVVVPVLVGGRPVAVHLVGRPGDEHRLLAAAARLENCVVPTTAGAPRRVYV